MRTIEIQLIITIECYFNFIIKTGVAGFEPTNGGIKTHSLTTWRHPRNLKSYIGKIGQEGIRTPDTVVRSHVL